MAGRHTPLFSLRRRRFRTPLHEPDERLGGGVSRPIDAADFDADSAFLSERGLILIGSAVFCALVWSTVFLWIFG
ncbi:MAG: hypothetical protein VXW22_08235 [Pseudomonadota bacterium]|nr:hypothetical protein [Pseudomonadota bacterium]